MASLLKNCEQQNFLLNEFYKIISSHKVELFNKIAAQRTRHITVVLENVYQEHNASAVLRTCDCFGVQDLNIIEKGVKYKVQRDIALGSGRWVDVHQFNQGNDVQDDCINYLKTKSFQLIATSPHSEKSIESIDLSKPTAFLFGTERQGLSTYLLNQADETICIPMYGFTESFNISVSVALILQHTRNILEKSNINWKLTEFDQNQLKIEWSKKILNGGEELEKFFINEFLK
ncbi:MAG: RNA methyltransferase [Flavobacteriia bacterium]|nr:RNA methyltransferase [Flavobacteriia bacterium]